MAYPACPRLAPLPEWRGTALRLRGAELDRLKAFMISQYETGRSLRQIAELTDRSFSDVRSILAGSGVQRRSVGAQVIASHRRDVRRRMT